MLLSIPVSVGEIMDKITILEIKSERIVDAEKVANVITELNTLRPLVSHDALNTGSIKALIAELKDINEALE